MDFTFAKRVPNPLAMDGWITESDKVGDYRIRKGVESDIEKWKAENVDVKSSRYGDTRVFRSRDEAVNYAKSHSGSSKYS